MMSGLGLVLWQNDATSSRPKAGDVFVKVGDTTKTPLTPRDIPIGAAHRLENPGKILLELIEVQTGSYLGEDDIIRIEDDYRRS